MLRKRGPENINTAPSPNSSDIPEIGRFERMNLTAPQTVLENLNSTSLQWRVGSSIILFVVPRGSPEVEVKAKGEYP